MGFPAVSDKGDPLFSVFLSWGGGGREGERLKERELCVLLALAFEKKMREDLGSEVIPTPGKADTDGMWVRLSQILKGTQSPPPVEHP